MGVSERPLLLAACWLLTQAVLVMRPSLPGHVNKLACLCRRAR